MKSSFLVRVETRDYSVEKEQPAGSPRTSIVPQLAGEYNVKYGKISYQISGPASIGPELVMSNRPVKNWPAGV